MLLVVWGAFLTGLLAGGASCAIVQGGLLTALAARRAGARPAGAGAGGVRADLGLVGLFLLGKLISYTILGFILGLVGQALAISPQAQAVLYVLAGLLMIVMALDLMGVKWVGPLVPEVPDSWGRAARKQGHRTGWGAPFALGLAMVLVPCGVTISMELAAVASGSPWVGAAIMAAFVVGTAPVFTAVAVAAQRLSTAWGGRLSAAIGVVVLLAAGVTINNGLNLAGSPWTLGSLLPGGESAGAAAAITGTGQEVVIDTTSTAYTPSVVLARPGVPLTLVMRTADTAGCIRSFIIADLAVSAMLPETGETRIELGALRVGQYPFMCSMGMYTGKIEVRA